MRTVLLTAVFLFAAKWFLVALMTLSCPGSGLVEALPEKSQQFPGRMEPALRAGINFLDPPFEKAFRGSGVSSKSNYKCESHMAYVWLTLKMDLCRNRSLLTLTIGPNKARPKGLTFPVGLLLATWHRRQ